MQCDCDSYNVGRFLIGLSLHMNKITMPWLPSNTKLNFESQDLATTVVKLGWCLKQQKFVRSTTTYDCDHTINKFIWQSIVAIEISFDRTTILSMHMNVSHMHKICLFINQKWRYSLVKMKVHKNFEINMGLTKNNFGRECVKQLFLALLINSQPCTLCIWTTKPTQYYTGYERCKIEASHYCRWSRNSKSLLAHLRIYILNIISIVQIVIILLSCASLLPYDWDIILSSKLQWLYIQQVCAAEKNNIVILQEQLPTAV